MTKLKVKARPLQYEAICLPENLAKLAQADVYDLNRFVDGEDNWSYLDDSHDSIEIYGRETILYGGEYLVKHPQTGEVYGPYPQKEFDTLFYSKKSK